MRVRHMSVLLLSCIALASCASHTSRTVSTPSGLSYRIVARGSGPSAKPVKVAGLVADGTLPAEKVADLTAEQQPEDLKAAVLEAIAAKVSKTDAVVADYTQVLKDIGATKTEATTAVKDFETVAVAEEV